MEGMRWLAQDPAPIILNECLEWKLRYAMLAYLRLSLRLSYHSFASLGWLPPHAAVIHPSWKDSRAPAQVKDGLVWFGLVRLVHFTDLLGSLH
ncbi:MAG: hypothetical protein QXI39_05160 [Candidatus Bathyarchaeia archaeon]